MADRSAQSRLSYVNVAVGGFVLVAAAVLLLAAWQSARVQRWFDPGQEIKVILPQEGLFGLNEGADVEVLGTRAGTVSRIVIEPDQNIHAIVHIRRDMLPFIRQDSQVLIQKRFGVAGASYLEITRGSGERLDWDYAVLKAEANRSPSETLNRVLTEVQTRVIPMIDDARSAMKSWTALADKLRDPEGDVSKLTGNLASITKRVDRGEGTLGRLVTEEEFAQQLDSLARRTNALLDDLSPAIEDARKTSRNFSKLSGNLAEQSESLPELTERLTDNLQRLQSILGDLKKTTPKLPKIADNVNDATENMPALVLQANQTLHELEKLIQRLQEHWLLGGEQGRPEGEGQRLAPWENQP